MEAVAVLGRPVKGVLGWDGGGRRLRPLRAQGADRFETRRQRGLGVRLGMPVRAYRLAGHDPDGAVRMRGIAAAVHGSMGLNNIASLRCFTAQWRAAFID
jgi:hypothetical protein